ncbi:MAG: hypothetical protein GX596_07875 [Propionibacterium sp.]|nr:hypothetical protein [Propionibacterium sp.]
MFDDEEVIRVYVPPGWPGGVRPPGSPGWLKSAEAFLLDVSPSEYRGYPVLRRHPVVLARLAHTHVEAQLGATRSALGAVRADLADYVEARVATQAVEVMQVEEARLIRSLRGVHLVEEALHDVRFVPKL